jgi:hypothetical protein
MNRSTWLTAGTVALLGGLHLAGLRPGHGWGDDFGLYVAHARNLAEGRPYADTGYVYNPEFPVLSPRTYPPVFPLLLAPVYRLFGLDLHAMKAFEVLLFVALLGVLAAVLRRRLPLPYVLGVLVLFGLNPYVWKHKDRLLSEVPFMLFAYLALLLADRAYEPGRARPGAVGWGLLAGLAAFLAFGTRTVGVVLVPSIVGAEFLRRRRLGVASPAVALAFAAGVITQRLLLPPDGSYLDQLKYDPALFVRVALSLGRAMSFTAENGYNEPARNALYLCMLLPAGVGYFLRLREGVTACELFAPSNLLLLVVWPAAEREQRFLMPLLPLFFLYAADGLRRLVAKPLARLERPAGAGLAAAVLLSYAAAHTRMEAGPFREGVSTRESAALFDWVRAETRPEDVFLFQKPRALALFTGRHASGHPVSPVDESLLKHINQSGTTHVVVCRQSGDLEYSRKILQPFIDRNAARFRAVYQTPVFTVYRVEEAAMASR